jgi:hypothetical protein
MIGTQRLGCSLVSPFTAQLMNTLSVRPSCSTRLSGLLDLGYWLIATESWVLLPDSEPDRLLTLVAQSSVDS